MEAAAIAAADADVVLVEADALDASRLVAPVGSAVLAAVAGIAGTPVWAVAGCGRRLPSPMIEVIAARLERDDDYWMREAETLPLGLVAHVVGPMGRRPASDPAAVQGGVRDGAGAAPVQPDVVPVASVPRMPSRRQQIAMTDDERDAFLDEQRVLNVATIGPTGHPHLVAMWYAMLDGHPSFWTFGKSQKIVNLRRDPRITALVESGDSLQRVAGGRAGRDGADRRGLRRRSSPSAGPSPRSTRGRRPPRRRRCSPSSRARRASGSAS